MKIAAPQYTTLMPASNEIKQTKHKYICSTEQSITTLTNSGNSIPISHSTYSGCTANAASHAFVRAESMFHYYISQNRNLDSKSYPPSANSFVYRDEEQPATYREISRRKPGMYLSKNTSNHNFY